MKPKQTSWDIIVAGSGMGGLSSASLLSNEGFSVLVLEAANVAGGCSSSYSKKGYVFESGATTLIGFDKHQPLRYLEDKLGINIPKQHLSIPMIVHQKGKKVTRYQERDKWVEECIRHFGHPQEMRRFWELCFRISDLVWKLSEKNQNFPPHSLSDWLAMGTKNNPLDVWILKYAFKSTRQVISDFGIQNDDFIEFIDEQLIITAQNFSDDTPFLFACPALTYTNSGNYYVPGGLIKMVECLAHFIENNGGQVATNQKVTSARKVGQKFVIETHKDEKLTCDVFISNIPIWDMATIWDGEESAHFQKYSKQFDKAWGALSIGIVVKDNFKDLDAIHHQIHLKEPVPETNSKSLFVSISHPDDVERNRDGNRVINVSCHADVSRWWKMNGEYEISKKRVEEFVLDTLDERLPGFDREKVEHVFVGTPVTWQKWAHRSLGRVGGLPQSMSRSLLSWVPRYGIVDGMFMCGDTTYPGQGIPGVTLGGINVYLRAKKYFQRQKRDLFV